MKPLRRGRSRGRLRRRMLVLTVAGSMMTLLLGATPGLAADSGTVDAQVTVSAAAACIELSTTAIDFGTLALGAENAPAAPAVTVTNCGDSDATIMASGTNAVGTGAAWTLVDSTATCADTLGTDNYHLGLQTPLGAPIATLSTANKEVGTLAAAGTVDHVATVSMACPGSSGAGQAMSMQINYLATSVAAPPIVLAPLTADQTTADAAAAFVLPASQDREIPSSCSGNPTIACPGGAPSNPLPQVRIQASALSAVQVAGMNQWNATVTLDAATLQDIPITYTDPTLGAVSCTVGVATANGSVPTVQGSFTMTFLSYPNAGGPTNYIAFSNANITGLESADVTLNGGFTCSLLNSFTGIYIPLFEGQVAAYIEGNLCGGPTPGTFMACPALP
jgi:hypothetical protein